MSDFTVASIVTAAAGDCQKMFMFRSFANLAAKFVVALNRAIASLMSACFLWFVVSHILKLLFLSF